MTPRVLDSGIYNTFADALEYPREDYHDRLLQLEAIITEYLPDDLQEKDGIIYSLHKLEEYVRSEDTGLIQEHYSATFDLKPSCTLSVSYHIFGDSYKRGRMLAGLQEYVQRFRLEGVPNRLPDELPVLLRLLPLLYAGDESDAREEFDLLAICVLPGISRMETSFTDNDNPFGGLITASAGLLRFDHPQALKAVPSLATEVLLP